MESTIKGLAAKEPNHKFVVQEQKLELTAKDVGATIKVVNVADIKAGVTLPIETIERIKDALEQHKELSISASKFVGVDPARSVDYLEALLQELE